MEIFRVPDGKPASVEDVLRMCGQEPKEEEKLATRFFRGQDEKERLEDELCEALLLCVGVTYWEGKAWPCSDLWFDGYDSSFEFGGCKDDWCPTTAQVNAMLELGFERCWFNYDNLTERYCTKDYVGQRTKTSRKRGNGETARVRNLKKQLVTGQEKITVTAKQAFVNWWNKMIGGTVNTDLGQDEQFAAELGLLLEAESLGQQTR